MAWYYISERRERVKFAEGEVSEMVRGGLLRPETMVWSEGMTDWVSVSEVHPEWVAEAVGTAPHQGAGGEGGSGSAASATATVREVATGLGRARPWWLFLAGTLVAVGAVVVVWLGYAILTSNTKAVIWALAALPLAVFGTLAAVGVVRCASGLAAAGESGQPSLLSAEVERLGRALRLLSAGIGTSLVLAVLAGIMIAVFYPG